MNKLSFGVLSQANDERAREWTKSATRALGVEFAMIELAGEVGELANEIKKSLRAASGLVGGKVDDEQIRRELADVVICADLLARKLGIDLGEAVVEKFNYTSRKHGFVTCISLDGVAVLEVFPSPAVEAVEGGK